MVLFLSFIISALSVCFSLLGDDDIFDYILSQSIELSNPNINSSLNQFDTTDGSFKDIDYESVSITRWQPEVHLDRLILFANAYLNENNAYYRNTNIRDNIIKGLSFWMNKSPRSRNWWYQQIPVPQKISSLLVLLNSMSDGIPQSLIREAIEYIKKTEQDPNEYTGANKADIALVWINISCLEKDQVKLSYSIKCIYELLDYSRDEGFLYDHNFFQHGRQLYIGGYGITTILRITDLAFKLRNTDYRLPDDKLSVLSTVVRETLLASIRGRYLSYNALGRNISRKNSISFSYPVIAQRMISIDPNYKDVYSLFLERYRGNKSIDYLVKSRHTHYFYSDYSLHIRPGYTFDVRLSSDRTDRCEYLNGENLKGYYLSDGSNNLLVDGDEYYNIFPVWNWNQVPGTTSPQRDDVPIAPKSLMRGSSTFAGGVSDSLYGVTTYVYNDTLVKTSAKKSWFFFDDEIVCLGAGIRSETPFNLYTTVNQIANKSADSIEVRKNGELKKYFNYTLDSDSIDFVVFGKVGYFFPSKTHLLISEEEKIGSWKSISSSLDDNPIHQRVASICLDHGINPEDESYSYIILPNLSSFSDFKTPNDIEIKENNANIQVVRHVSLDIWQFVFFEPMAFSDSQINIKVDKPCVVMVKGINEKKPVLHIADPAQNQEEIQLTIQIPSLFERPEKMIIDFKDTGVYAGASKRYDLIK